MMSELIDKAKKHIILMGRVSNEVNPKLGSPKFEFVFSEPSVESFFKEVRPTTVRRVRQVSIGAGAAKRSLSVFENIAPTEAGEAALEDVWLPVRESDLTTSDAGLDTLEEYGRFGAEQFKELLRHTDELAAFAHPNFACALVKLATQWVRDELQESDIFPAAQWEIADDNLASELVGFLTSSDVREAKIRLRAVSTALGNDKYLGLEAEMLKEIRRSLLSLHDALHSSTEHEKIQRCEKRLKWGEDFESRWKPFGVWSLPNSAGSFHQVFERYRVAKHWVDSFVRDMTRQAYVMSYVMSKYGDLTEFETVAHNIYEHGVERQPTKQRRVGIPADSSEEGIATAIKADLPDKRDKLNADENQRRTRVLPTLIENIKKVFVPSKGLDRGIWDGKAISIFESLLGLISEDPAVTNVTNASLLLKDFANLIRSVLLENKGQSNADQLAAIQTTIKARIAELSSEDGEIPKTVARVLKEAVKGLSVGEGRSIYEELAGRVTSALDELGLTVWISQSPETTATQKRQVRQYRTWLSGDTRSESESDASATGAANMPVAGKMHDGSLSPSEAILANRAARKQQAESRQSAVHAERASIQVPALSEGINNRSYSAEEVHLSGGTATVKDGNVFLKPAVVTIDGHELPTDANDDAIKSLSDEGIILDAISGNQVGTYEKKEGEFAPTFSDSSNANGPLELRSGKAKLPSELSFKLNRSKFFETNQFVGRIKEGRLHLNAAELDSFESWWKSDNPTATLHHQENQIEAKISFERRVVYDATVGILEWHAPELPPDALLELVWSETSTVSREEGEPESVEFEHIDSPLGEPSEYESAPDDLASIFAKAAEHHHKHRNDADAAFFVKNNRERVLRELVSKTPSGEIPFGKENLGNPLEIIAQALNTFGDTAKPDLQEFGPTDSALTLNEIDFTQAYAECAEGDLRNALHQFEIICEKAERTKPYLRNLRHVKDLFASFEDSDCRITFYNCTLKQYLKALKERHTDEKDSPDNAFFLRDPAAFVYLLDAVETSDLDTLVEWMKRGESMAPEQMQYPLVGAHESAIDHFCSFSNAHCFPETTLQRFGAESSNPALNWICSVMRGATFDLGGPAQEVELTAGASKILSKWRNTQGWQKLDTLGTALLFKSAQGWEAGTLDTGIWNKLAQVRLTNMSLQKSGATFCERLYKAWIDNDFEKYLKSLPGAPARDNLILKDDAGTDVLSNDGRDGEAIPGTLQLSKR